MENKKHKVYIAGLVFIFAFFAYSTSAATLQLSSRSTSMTVDDMATVYVLLNSDGVAVNNAEATISFPTDLFSVISVSKGGSVFTMWIEDPVFSNSAGIVTFNGGLPTPGFVGTQGTVLSFAVKAKKAGQGTIAFSNAAVRADDGLGTDVLFGKQNIIFNIAPVQEEKPLPEKNPALVLGYSPEISSSTHPDQNKWYNNSNPEFSWGLPQDVTAVRIGYDKNPNGNPTVLYDNPIAEKSLQDIKDGIYYFHAQFRNASGWGQSSNFNFKIDSEKPNLFEINQALQTGADKSGVSFNFLAEDKTSGIDHYEISIDNGDTIIWKDDGTHIYRVPTLLSGKHVLVARAVDGAGNYLANFAEFNIESVQSPVITFYPKNLLPESIFAVRGTVAQPGTIVEILVKDKKGQIRTYNANRNEGGEFIVLDERGLENGKYELWAVAKNINGVLSNPSEKVVVLVGSPVLFKIYKIAFTYFGMFLALILFDIALTVFAIIMWLKLSRKKRRPKARAKAKAKLK
jgi:hypothetical protein